MNEYNLNTIASPEVLAKIDESLLLEFLRRFETALNAADISISGQTRPRLDALRQFLLQFEPDTCPRLAEALYSVNEMARPECHDALIEACEELGLETSLTGTTADLAIRLWLKDPVMLERKHAEAWAYNNQRYDYYRPASVPPAPFTMPSQARLDRLAQDLDVWFERTRRGSGSRVFCYERTGKFYFLILRGDPHARVEVFGAETSAIHFRPARYDVLIYDPATGEIGVNTQIKGLRQEYLIQFGAHLFGSPGHFPQSLKYDLTPLMRDGAASLHTAEFSHVIEWIKLVEVRFHRGGSQNASLIYQADDIFADLAERGEDLPVGRILSAKFDVKFCESRRARKLTITPPRTAKMSRDGDACLLEQWLPLRTVSNQ